MYICIVETGLIVMQEALLPLNKLQQQSMRLLRVEALGLI